MKDNINDYKNQIMNVVVIIVAIFISYNIYTGQSKEVSRLSEKKNLETQKNGILEEIRVSEGKIGAYKKFINDKELSSVVNKLNAITKDYSVNILSIKPTGVKESALYFQYPFSLKIEVADYDTIGKLVSKLESDPDIFHVTVLSVYPESVKLGTRIKKMSVELKVDTFLLKE